MKNSLCGRDYLFVIDKGHASIGVSGRWNGFDFMSTKWNDIAIIQMLVSLSVAC